MFEGTMIFAGNVFRTNHHIGWTQGVGGRDSSLGLRRGLDVKEGASGFGKAGILGREQTPPNCEPCTVRENKAQIPI